MRILLVWPRNERAVLSDELSRCEPLPLEYLAGALRAHHDVTIHDLRLDPPLREYAETNEPPDLVGIAVPYTTNVPVSRRASQEAKRLWPDVPVVLGGHHVTVSREWMDGFAADYVIAGEGADPLLTLIGHLERGTPVEPVTGLAPYGARSELRRTVKPEPATLNSLPRPDRSLLTRHRNSYFHSIYNPVALVRFSAGCPYQCHFCSLWRITDRRYLVKEAERVVSELEEIEQRNLYVVDDEAFIQPARMLELADAIDQAKLDRRYHMYVRTDTALRRPDVITRWAEIGLDSVLVGAESMTDDELNGYHKGTSARQTREALDLFHSLGVKVRANFIVNPSWDEADFERLSRTVEELGVDMPSFSVLTPLPGTDLYDEVRDQLVDDDPELFDCYHSLFRTRLPRDRFYDRLARLLVAAGSRGGGEEAGDPSVFYYSNDDSFSRMVQAVRRGGFQEPSRRSGDAPPPEPALRR